MAFDTITVTISSSVGRGGTFAVSYPAGRTAADYDGKTGHRITAQRFNPLYSATGDFSLALGASEITVTILFPITLVAGETIYLELEREEQTAAPETLFSVYGDLTADTSLTYTTGSASTVRTGDRVHVRTGHVYEVAASGASDQHVTTAGGVKFYEVGCDYTTRARLVAAKARGETWQDGWTIRAAGRIYKSSAGATGIPDLLGLVPVAPVTFAHFGAVGDGATNDAAAVDQAFVYAGTLYGENLIYKIDTAGGVSVRSNTHVYDATFLAGSNLGLDDAMISNPNGPVARVRQDSHITFENCVFDGAGRTWPTYPTTNYNLLGELIKFISVESPSVINCEVKNHQSNAIFDQGSRNAKYIGLRGHDCGKIDMISSPLYIGPRGTWKKILNITNANPAVVTIDSESGALASGNRIWIEDVPDMASVPDGEYEIANVSGTTFELVGIDTSGDNAFVYEGLASINFSGATSNGTVCEDVLIDHCQFYDNRRSGVSFIPKTGTLTNCRFFNNGETAIFADMIAEGVIANNVIDTQTMTDIVGGGIELNFIGKVILSNNVFANTATAAISVNGVAALTITNNMFRNIITDASITHPNMPFAVAAGIVGDPLDTGKTCIIRIASFQTCPCKNVRIAHNTFVEGRAAAEATSIINIGQSGGTQLVYDLHIYDNDVSASKIAKADMIFLSPGNVTLPRHINIRNNYGHFSELPHSEEVTISATGTTVFNVGFVPSRIEVLARVNSAANLQECRALILRDRTVTAGGNLGKTWYRAIDAITTTPTVAIGKSTNDFYKIVDNAGTVIALAEWSTWECDSVDGIGFSINATTATTAVDVWFVAYP